MHSHRRLLAARIGILPFFFLKSRKKETKAIEKEKKAKCRFLQLKVVRVTAIHAQKKKLKKVMVLSSENEIDLLAKMMILQEYRKKFFC